MNEEKKQIPITEGMSEDLKAAINYLNEHNISLTAKFETDEDDDIEEDNDGKENKSQ